jgi:translation initiation factor 1
MASKKREDRSSTSPDPSFESPFARLARLKHALPPGEAKTLGAPSPTPLRGKVVVRRERKGRGGKTVTVVEGLGLEDEVLEAYARELKRALGCGALVEGAVIVLQGAHEERARAYLEERGAERVVLGTRS